MSNDFTTTQVDNAQERLILPPLPDVSMADGEMCWLGPPKMDDDPDGLPETLSVGPLVQEDDGTIHQLPLRFNGPAYDPALDHARLTGQCRRVFEALEDAQWWTLGEISLSTGDPEASISAQLRHLRKPRFGGHTVNKRRRGSPGRGWWEYQLVVNTEVI